MIGLFYKEVTMTLKINRLALTASVLSLLSSAEVIAEPNVSLMKSKYDNSAIPLTSITQLVKQNFDTNQYAHVKTQVMYNNQQQADHILVYLFSKQYHHFNVARMNVNSKLQVTSVEMKYQLSRADYAQQPGITVNEAKCPDDSIEFIALAADVYGDISVKVTKEVVAAAKAQSLKTVGLWKTKKATRENYLNYMACPNLKGNFYNGYTNSDYADQIVTADGVITYSDIDTLLNKKFRYKVTNIWVIDKGYNDPLKSSLIDVAQAQKYAAGMGDLLVGPSDLTAACAMKAAIKGEPMKAAFDACYLQYDNKADQWGFGGNGADIFGT
jgi:hypothetical protein